MLNHSGILKKLFYSLLGLFLLVYFNFISFIAIPYFRNVILLIGPYGPSGKLGLL